MLVACRLGGLSAFEAHYAVGGTGHNRETGGNVEDVGNVGVI